MTNPAESPSGGPGTTDHSVDAIVSANLREVHDRITGACARAHRDCGSVALVAVTKYAELAWVRALAACGQSILGENRPQQLVARAAEIDAGVEWHLVGPLQRNKVRIVLPVATLVHSVDSLKLLEAIERIAGELDLSPRVLLEINLSLEPAKHGFALDQIRAEWDQIQAFKRVRVEGLMTMAAYSPEPEDARPVFAALRDLRDELRTRSGMPLEQLSMGMSGDFEVAIEEGATLVRIGTALWQGLA